MKTNAGAVRPGADMNEDRFAMDFKFDLPGLETLLSRTESNNDLSDEGVVTLLVRGFVDRCLDGFQAVINGEREQDEVAEGIYRLAEVYNGLFLGKSGLAEVKTHPWNAPEQLGAFLVDAVGLDFPADEAVRATLIHLATQIMTALHGDPAGWRGTVERMIGEVRDLLLGRLPPAAISDLDEGSAA